MQFLRFILGLYLAPKASKGFNEFNYKYLKNDKNDRPNEMFIDK